MFTDLLSWVWNTLCDFFVAVLVFVLIYNPVAFLLWSIFAPKKAARAATSGLFHWMEKMVKPMHYLYPFYMKKHFIKEYGLWNYSLELQRRTFFSFRKNSDVQEMTSLFQTMSKECYNAALSGATSVDQEAALLADITLSAEDLKLLSACNVRKYAEKHTLPTEYLIWIFKTYHVSANEEKHYVSVNEQKHSKTDSWNYPSRIQNHSTLDSWNYLSKILLFHVERHGATKEFIDFLNRQNDEAFKADFKKALKAFSERQVVYQMRNPKESDLEFSRYVQANPVLEPQTQKLLCPWQLEIFLKFYQPADEAVCSLLRKGDLSIANILFNNKGVQFSETAKMLIKSDSNLLMAYIRSGRHF